jgi:hypothetical protein
VDPAFTEPGAGTDRGPRACGECKACCNGWLSAEIHGHRMGDGVPCRYLRPDGCGIYERRPEVCRSFVCGWLKPGSPFPEHWRPDKLGMIIREGQWEGRRCWLVQFAGKDAGDEVLEVMRHHSIATGEPHIIKKRDSWLCFGTPEFRQAMVRLSQQSSRASDLKSILHFW